LRCEDESPIVSLVRRRKQMLLGVACALVVGGVAAGIVLVFGGSSRASPTKAEYFARVAAICRVYGPKLDRIAPPTDLAIPGAVVTPVSKALPIVEAEIREVSALRPPEGLAAQVEQWLSLEAKARAALRQTLRDARLPDIRRLGPDWLAFLDAASAAARVGKKIGFPKVCSGR
jgi:hypothetical protein